MRPRCEGLALVLVLWVVALLSIMAATLAHSMRTESRIAVNLRDNAQARAIAEAAVYFALTDLRLPAEQRTLELGVERPNAWAFDEGKVRIEVVNTAGLVDLNSSRRGLLAILLQGVGVPLDERHGLLDALEDWRDPDSTRRPHGAEDPDYAWGAKDGDFDAVEELQEVRGLSLPLYRALAPLVTVNGFSRQVNPTLAPPELRAILAQGDAGLIQAWGEGGTLGAVDPALAPFVANVKRANYRLRVWAEGIQGGRASLRVVLGLPPGRPPQILVWRDQAGEWPGRE